MKKILLIAAAGLVSANIYASDNCFGSESMYTCTDYKTGNTYNVNKFGNTTQVQASNSRTGSTWSQNTQTYGNQSYTSGYDQKGNSWQHNTNQIGNTQYYNGNDSKGSHYNGSCNPYAGCTTNKYGR